MILRALFRCTACTGPGTPLSIVTIESSLEAKVQVIKYATNFLYNKLYATSCWYDGSVLKECNPV